MSDITDFLKKHQVQMDSKGLFVEVSRSALDEALAEHAALQKEVEGLKEAIFTHVDEELVCPPTAGGPSLQEVVNSFVRDAIEVEVGARNKEIMRGAITPADPQALAESFPDLQESTEGLMGMSVTEKENV